MSISTVADIAENQVLTVPSGDYDLVAHLGAINVHRRHGIDQNGDSIVFNGNANFVNIRMSSCDGDGT